MQVASYPRVKVIKTGYSRSGTWNLLCSVISICLQTHACIVYTEFVWLSPVLQGVILRVKFLPHLGL
jgi:hypothetical protein